MQHKSCVGPCVYVTILHSSPCVIIAFYIFSPDGKSLVFLSAKTSVDSGAHSATDSLHKIEWPSNGKLGSSLKITDVVYSCSFNFN